MSLLTFDKTYATGIEFIDEQHAGLFEALNDLYAALLRGKTSAVTGSLLQDLLAYTRSHFAAEEAMLARAKYPGLVEHRSKHQRLTDQVSEYVDRYKRGEAALSVDLLKFLRHWFINHILREDRAYGAWLAQAGVRL